MLRRPRPRNGAILLVRAGKTIEERKRVDVSFEQSFDAEIAAPDYAHKQKQISSLVRPEWWVDE